MSQAQQELQVLNQLRQARQVLSQSRQVQLEQQAQILLLQDRLDQPGLTQLLLALQGLLAPQELTALLQDLLEQSRLVQQVPTQLPQDQQV